MERPCAIAPSSKYQKQGALDASGSNPPPNNVGAFNITPANTEHRQTDSKRTNLANFHLSDGALNLRYGLVLEARLQRAPALVVPVKSGFRTSALLLSIGSRTRPIAMAPSQAMKARRW